MKQVAKQVALALGESTHTHMMKSNQDIHYEMGEESSIRFLLKDTGVVLHEEHDRIVLQAQYHVKVNQVEFNPFTNTVSSVWD